ncbi:hypothetical protein [Pseudooctadecabacter sp.]|uniref:hypothetical protein n=1 Tax=Pseudooctadecabacter sp. TaxID=1966338 RepID=UPI0025DCA13B|nr:hypothetical protein [Pseudooctadecabacter sp.]
MIWFALCVLAAGCAPVVPVASPPTLPADTIFVRSTSPTPDRIVQAEAERICATRAQFADFVTTVPPLGTRFLYRHHYLCKNATPVVATPGVAVVPATTIVATPVTTGPVVAVPVATAVTSPTLIVQ